MFKHWKYEQLKNSTSLSTTPDTEEEIAKVREGLEAYRKKIAPWVNLMVLISLALSILGILAILPEATSFRVFKAILYGGSIGLVQGIFWMFMFQRARDIETRGGLATYLAIFVIVGALVIAPSWITNFTGLAFGGAQQLTYAESAGELGKSVREVKPVGALIVNLHRKLVSQQEYYAERQLIEIAGEGISARKGVGHISNTLGFASGLYETQAEIAGAYATEYKALELKLDQTYATFQQQVKANDFGAGSFAESFASVTSVIASIGAIDPKLIAASTAAEIDTVLDIPSRAKDWQVKAIKGINRELKADAVKIRAMAQGFTPVELPSVDIQSDFNISLSQVTQQLPFAILALLIDVIAPVLLCLTIPALLKIIRKIKILNEKDIKAKNKVDGEDMILTTDLIGMIDRENVKKAKQYAQNNQEIADILQTGTVGNVTKPQDDTDTPDSDADEINDNPDTPPPSGDSDADDKPYTNGKDHNSNWFGDGWKPTKKSDDDGEGDKQ